MAERDLKRLASALRERRGQLGLSQEQFAQLAGVSLKTLQRAESGTKAPRATTLARLDHAAGWPEGTSVRLLDSAHAPVPGMPDVRSSEGAGPEPGSAEWLRNLREQLPEDMFWQVVDQVTRRQPPPEAQRDEAEETG